MVYIGEPGQVRTEGTLSLWALVSPMETSGSAPIVCPDKLAGACATVTALRRVTNPLSFPWASLDR